MYQNHISTIASLYPSEPTEAIASVKYPIKKSIYCRA